MPKTNCPNCGAPLKNGFCEYCGTEVDPAPRRELQRELERLYAERQRLEIQFVQNMQSQYSLAHLGRILRGEA